MSMMISSLEQLNDPQRLAVTTTEGPVLVIAGAGSGKTRVLTERIAYLLQEKEVEPWRILAFTFTNKAAREMKDRLAHKVPSAVDDLWVGTFHATGVRILRRHGEGVNIAKGFSIYDTDDTTNLVKGIMSRRIVDQRAVKSPKSLRDQISRLKNELITPAMALQQANSDIDAQIAELYAEYQKELRRANAVDFDDLIGKVVELFSVDLEARNFYARKFKYILVDEFQDTNPIQMAMIDSLQSHYANLFVVGDDDQSIYSWRGAKVEHILEFEALYPDTKLIRLEQNYRSTKTILKAANQVIENNVGRKGKTLWTDGPKGERVHMLTSMDEEAEAINVLAAVRDQVNAGVKLRDIAVLYRTNAQSRALEDALRMGSTPYQIIGGVRFYERMEIRDVLAYCKVLANPSDSVNLRRIINVPKRGIGKTTFERLETAALDRDTSVVDVLRRGVDGLSLAAGRRLAAFLDTFDSLSRVTEEKTAPEVIEAIIAAVDYREYLESNYPDAETRIENVEELINAAHAFVENSEEKTLAAFLEEVALVADVDNLDTEAGALTLMTLHNAKGLEYDVVLMAGMEEGLFPHFNSIDDPAAVEEERRLFYVGITRAKQRLFVSHAGMRRRMGHIEAALPSRFLYELPPDCVDAPLREESTEQSFSASQSASSSFTERTRDWFSRDDVPSQDAEYDDFSQEELPGFRVGMRIEHDNFGRGVVRRVEGSAENTRVTVLFDAGSERKFLARYAPMRPVS